MIVCTKKTTSQIPAIGHLLGMRVRLTICIYGEIAQRHARKIVLARMIGRHSGKRQKKDCTQDSTNLYANGIVRSAINLRCADLFLARLI